MPGEDLQHPHSGSWQWKEVRSFVCLAEEGGTSVALGPGKDGLRLDGQDKTEPLCSRRGEGTGEGSDLGKLGFRQMTV